MLRRFTKSQIGSTSVEYALIAALVALALIASFFAINDEMISMYDFISSNVGNALS